MMLVASSKDGHVTTSQLLVRPRIDCEGKQQVAIQSDANHVADR